MMQPGAPQMPTADHHQYYQQQQHWGGAPPPQQQGYGGWSAQGSAAAAGAGQSGGGANEVKSLWIGDLQPWMDETYLMGIFSYTGEVLSAKVIRSKQTGMPEGYGFIEFANRAGAERVLSTVNGTPMPQTEQNFRMNWAALGAGERRQDDGPEHTIFVGDLAAEVTDYVLQETFKATYPSVKGAKVVTDKATGRSKGYGFVKFGDENEQIRAMAEMNGVVCSSRPMRIGPAANKKSVGIQQNQNGIQEALIWGPGISFS